jgi:hypothetical protein
MLGARGGTPQGGAECHGMASSSEAKPGRTERATGMLQLGWQAHGMRALIHCFKQLLHANGDDCGLEGKTLKGGG